MSANSIYGGYVARRQQLQGLSKRWLTVSQQLETAVRSVDAPLTNAVTRIEALSAEFALVIDKLKSMGYPEKGSVAGLAAGITNAKSFVSCAIGRMT